jgi:hypothetical protein
MLPEPSYLRLSGSKSDRSQMMPVPIECVAADKLDLLFCVTSNWPMISRTSSHSRLLSRGRFSWQGRKP